jgi:DNA-binding transcriptional MerR regulator
LRHYERKGLLTSRRSQNGYREYSSHAVDRVRVIRRAISCGFTIDELATILKARDQGETPCHQVRKLAQEKLAAVEEQLRELEIIRDDLRLILYYWEARLSQTAENQAAGLLESLANRESVSLKNHTPIKRPSRKPNVQENS